MGPNLGSKMDPKNDNFWTPKRGPKTIQKMTFFGPQKLNKIDPINRLKIWPKIRMNFGPLITSQKWIEFSEKLHTLFCTNFVKFSQSFAIANEFHKFQKWKWKFTKFPFYEFEELSWRNFCEMKRNGIETKSPNKIYWNSSDIKIVLLA